MLLTLAALAVLIALNGIFAMSELAMMTARRSRLQHAAAQGSKGAATALKLASEPTKFLSTVQVGITLIGILAGALAEDTISNDLTALIDRVAWLRPYSDGIALAIVVLGITYFSLVLGELVPKRIALAHPEAIAAGIARPLARLAAISAWPVRALSASTDLILAILRVKPRKEDDVSEEDVRALVARAASTGVFTRQEYTLFQRTMRVADLEVRDLMVPRADVIWIDADSTVDEIHVLIGTSPFSHFPVCRGSLDDALGVVHIKDLLTYGLLGGRSFKVAEVARPPLVTRGDIPALHLMDEFRRAKTHIAFVVDPKHSVIGLVTLNDVVSALIGDFRRHGEEVRPRSVEREDGSWLLDGRLPLDDAFVSLRVGSVARPPGVSTVAGLLRARFGRIPVEGDRTDFGGWSFEVLDMDGSRIDKVLATKSAPPAE